MTTSVINVSTGLTAVVTGLMFLLCMFLAPVAAMIPPAATSI